MFKNFLNAIVGGDEGPTKPPEPARPPSQPPSGRSTPLSEIGSMLGGRRGSCSSLHSQISPVDENELDLSQLSKEERAQIEAVIARAREMQEEGEQRVREIEEDFGGPFQFAPIKPPAQSIKSTTSGPPTSVKPVPQPALGSKQTSPHKSSFSQPLSAASKAPQTQSSTTKAEPPKILPKPAAANTGSNTKATIKTTTSEKDGYGQSVASQKTDINRTKVKEQILVPAEKQQLPSQPVSAVSSRGMTRPLDKKQQRLPTTNGDSEKKTLASKNEITPQNRLMSGLTGNAASDVGVAAKQGHISAGEVKTQPKKSIGQRPVEQRLDQPGKLGGQANPSQFKPYPETAVASRLQPKQQSPHMILQQNTGSKQGTAKADQRPSAETQGSPQTKGDVKQQIKPGQIDIQNSKQQQHHHIEQKRHDLERLQQSEGEKSQSTSEQSVQQIPVQTNNSKKPLQPPLTQAKPKDGQPSGDIKPPAKNAKSKSPKPSHHRRVVEQEERTMCPLCTSNELNAHTASLCNVCETNICLNCGSFETSPRTKLKEWLCKICSQERRVMMEKKKGQAPSANAPQLEARSSLPSARHKNQRTSPEPGQKAHRPKSASAIDSCQRIRQPDYATVSHTDDKKGHIARPTEFKQVFPVPRSQQQKQQQQQQQQQTKPPPVRKDPSEEGMKRGHSDQGLSKDGSKPQPVSEKKDQPMRMVPQIVSGTIKMVEVPDITKEDRTTATGSTKNAASEVTKVDSYSTDTIKKRPDKINIQHEACDKANVPVQEPKASSQPNSDIISTPDKGRSPKSPRPTNLDINKKAATKQAQQPPQPLENIKPLECKVPTESCNQTNVAKDLDTHKSDSQKPVRTCADAADSMSSKRKPSPLDRVSLSEGMEAEKSPSSRRSPSRISPRSPPRSPSWMRYRESPPRSPNVKKHSPTKSPAERFPSNYSDLQTAEIEGIAYGDEFHFPAGTNVSSTFDPVNNVENHSNDIPPPKPARLSNQYGGSNGTKYDHMGQTSLDLASYAATVASSTAHLTSMSVSPTNVSQSEERGHGSNTVIQPVEIGHIEMSPEQGSMTPPSPNYYDDSDDMEMADPSEKSIDYGNKRQKIKPPATDWSPITDLSPIIDVSPSVEKIEQEKMLQEQQVGDREKLIKGSSKLERHKGYDDSSRQDPEAKSKQPNTKVEKGNESKERQSRIDGHHHVGLPHSNSEPAKPTQTINYPSRQANSLDGDTRFTPSKNRDTGRDIYHSHPSFEGDREIDLDVDIPPQKREAEKLSTIDHSDEAKQLNAESQNITFERQGGLVRSKLQIFSKDIISSDSESNHKHKTDPPKAKASIVDEHEAKSPKQKVLTSPESPNQGAVSGLGFDPSKEVTSSKLRASKEFIYPSPVTTPEKQMSPPCPASPSASSQSLQTPNKRHTAVSRSKSLDEGRIVAVRKSRSWDKSNQSPQSPGSDKERKTRRKLPTLPPTEKPEPAPAAPSNPVNTKMNSDKEILRKRLQEKAGRSRIQNQLEHSNKNRPQSAPPSKNNGENGSSRSLPKQPPATAPKPKLPKILGIGHNAKEKPPVPPKPRSRNSSVSQEDPEPEDTINIFGVEVPISVRAKKQRLREEIQIVTATRRLKIDEMEEVRIMERKLADREKMRRLRIEEEARKKAKLKDEEEREKQKLKKLEIEIQKQRDVERQLEKERVEAEENALADKLAKLEKEIYSRNEKEKAKHSASGSNTLSLVKMSPQSSPRRGKHRRQNSDPMLAKFSPIEEKDIENDMSFKLGIEARKLTSKLSQFSPQPNRKGVRSGSVTPTMSYSDYEDPLMKGSLRGSHRSKSSEILTMIDKDAILASSHSETDIPLSMIQRSRTHHFENEIEEKLSKEEKRQQLQMEIEKRRKALEENARLRYEIQKLTEAANVAPYEFEEIKTKYKKHVRSKDNVPTGIIRPLDSAAAATAEEQLNHFSAKDYTAYRDMMQRSTSALNYPDAMYSCSEYIAHQRSDKPMQNGATADTYFLQPPGESIPHIYPKGVSPNDLELIEKLGYQHALGQKFSTIDSFTGSRDSGMSSGSNFMEQGYLAMKPEVDANLPIDSQSEASITTTDTTPPSLKDVTPAMPILDDVTLRSRSKLRQIGSRPLSDDMGQYIDGTDLTSIFHAESDHSVAESDDHVMEGGVTIKERRDIKRPKTRDSAERRSYGFEIKRILLTKDPKDRSVAGNGIGMKIVGGKIIPGREEVGAYVADIYPGGVADQLHGELQEGDQVLEWNGIPLTGKTYEEVQHIISQPNGEIELLVRPGAKLSCKDQTMSTIRSESCHSSYDNLDPKVDVDTSDYEEFDGRFIDPRSDIDPDLVAARLGQNQVTHHPSHPPTKQTPLRPGQAPPEHHISPGASPSSSQQEMYLTPSVSMSGSTQSDPVEAPSPTVELPNLGADPEMDGRDPHDWGEIQLQLSYDDYDGTLNIHVMQAKGLRPKDRNGLSDPFVKCYLLPGRIGENKRRTKIINRCLDPEWHQTLVFMKISKDDLRTKSLEVAVWDYDRRKRRKEFKPNDFLGVVYLDLGELSILDNKPHWYKLHEPDDEMANQLSKPVTYAPTGTKQPITKPHGHSHPIQDSKHHDGFSHSPSSRPEPRYHASGLHHRGNGGGGNSSGSSGGGSAGNHSDRRDLQPPNSEHGAKYSPGLGRRKDIHSHRNENCDRSPKKIYLDLTSSTCDNEEFLYSAQDNGLNNMAMHANQKIGTNNNHSPLLTAYKSRHLASDTVSMSSTSSGISFDSRIVKSTSDVMNDNTPVKNIVNTMYTFLGPGQLLTNTRTKANGLAIVSGAAYAVTGEILLGLKQSECELVVSVIHCKGVTKRVLVAEAVQDWYVKVYLHEDGGPQNKVKKYKTSTQRTEKDPTFHETFAINTQFVEAFVEVSLWINRGMFGQNKAIGTIIIALKNIEFTSFKNSELMAYYKFLAPK